MVKPRSTLPMLELPAVLHPDPVMTKPDPLMVGGETTLTVSVNADDVPL